MLVRLAWCGVQIVGTSGADVRVEMRGIDALNLPRWVHATRLWPHVPGVAPQGHDVDAVAGGTPRRPRKRSDPRLFAMCRRQLQNLPRRMKCSSCVLTLQMGVNDHGLRAIGATSCPCCVMRQGQVSQAHLAAPSYRTRPASSVICILPSTDSSFLAICSVFGAVAVIGWVSAHGDSADSTSLP